MLYTHGTEGIYKFSDLAEYYFFTLLQLDEKKGHFCSSKSIFCIVLIEVTNDQLVLYAIYRGMH